MPSVSTRSVTRTHVEGLRSSAPALIQIQIQDLLRQHSDRIAVACMADLFAISEVELPALLSEEVKTFTTRAAREFIDLPNEEARLEFLSGVAMLPPAKAPESFRAAIRAMLRVSQEQASHAIEDIINAWEQTAPEVVRLPRPPAKEKPLKPAKVVPAEFREPGYHPPEPAPLRADAPGDEPVAQKPTPPGVRPKHKTPAEEIDPLRSDWIRKDVVERLQTREYADRGLKDAVLVAGCRHRATQGGLYRDVSEDEVRAELRRLAREGKVRQMSDRWIIK